MPHYADIGKSAKDLLVGNPKSGAFNYDRKLSFVSTTSGGVSFAVNAVSNDGSKVAGTVKISHATPKFSADATVDAKGKVSVNVSLAKALEAVVPGVKLGLSGALPDPSSAKLNVEYAPVREFACKTAVTLVSSPLVDASAAVMHQGAYAGGEVAYDTAKAAITKANAAVGYHAADFQVAAHLLNMGTLCQVSYCHTTASGSTLGAEVTRELSSAAATTFACGYARRVAGGALLKFKLDNTGTLSSMYETKLLSGEKLAGSCQVKATDLSAPLKYGFAVDLS